MSDGSVLYLGGTETFSCNRGPLRHDHAVWDGVRVGWTAVGWQCLTELERLGAHQRLSLIPREWLPALNGVGQAPAPDDEEGDDDDEPEAA